MPEGLQRARLFTAAGGSKPLARFAKWGPSGCIPYSGVDLFRIDKSFKFRDGILIITYNKLPKVKKTSIEPNIFFKTVGLRAFYLKKHAFSMRKRRIFELIQNKSFCSVFETKKLQNL